ncbi:PIN domain-containing protein [Streptomyces sasae]|uniref:PIN domain-containing protein n=1 Tax=Streptomyces sasae TaxID=1266772 RepID=UPI00292FD1D0|nr:PIN domain-containing protein [Streptomyces sasae]
MLITPRPGANRKNIRQVLRETRMKVENLRGSSRSAFESLLRYLEWATDAARVLRSQVSDRDLEYLVFTRRYQVLLGSSGTLAGTDQQRLVNGLVDLEITERIQAFEEAEAALDAQIGRWNGQEWFVVADSSFYIHNPDKLADVDLHKVLGLPSGEHIRLLFPIVVVDELDGLKEAGKPRARWRASHTLGLLDQTLGGSTFGILHRQELVSQDGEVRGEVNMEIVLDPPGHVRLPIADDEIIDRAVAIQPLAARDVRLLTCDTGQHTRGRAAGLQVTKVPMKDPGEEPDWEALDKPGTGVRAQRREKQAARDA